METGEKLKLVGGWGSVGRLARAEEGGVWIGWPKKLGDCSLGSREVFLSASILSPSQPLCCLASLSRLLSVSFPPLPLTVQALGLWSSQF